MVGPGNQSPSVESELKRLREENRQLKMERGILQRVNGGPLVEPPQSWKFASTASLEEGIWCLNESIPLFE